MDDGKDSRGARGCSVILGGRFWTFRLCGFSWSLERRERKRFARDYVTRAIVMSMCACGVTWTRCVCFVTRYWGGLETVFSRVFENWRFVYGNICWNWDGVYQFTSSFEKLESFLFSITLKSITYKTCLVEIIHFSPICETIFQPFSSHFITSWPKLLDNSYKKIFNKSIHKWDKNGLYSISNYTNKSLKIALIKIFNHWLL